MNPEEFPFLAQCERDFWWFRGMRLALFRVLDPYLKGRRIGRALEAGCGTGYFAQLLQASRKLPVIPLDIATEGLRYARAAGVKDPVQGNITALPFRGGAFDLLLSLDVLVHLPRGDEAGALAEFARVLAPGGLLVVRVSALDILRSRHSEFAMERQRFTRGRLLQATRAAGFRTLRCTYLNSLLMPVALAKFRLFEPLTRQAPASGVAPVAGWLNNLLYAPLAAEAAWVGAGGSFPVGQSLLLLAEKRA